MNRKYVYKPYSELFPKLFLQEKTRLLSILKMECLDAISTYPFPIFGHGWESAFNVYDLPVKGDIIVGNDVWFGYDSLVMNGVTIENGAIIATTAVVVKDVPAYSIVAGNPAKVVKMRFDDKTIDRLQKIAWWDWSIEKINQHLKLICHLDVDQLETVSHE